MQISRNTSVIYGALLLAAIVSGILSSVPMIEESDYLQQLHANEPSVLMGVFFQALMAIIYVLIIVVTYPIVRMYRQKSALAYLIFRSIGAVFLFVGIATLLLFLPLGREFVVADATQVAFLETIGFMLRQVRDWLNHIGMILPWSIGGIFLYWAFFKTGLIPRWLSVWGLIGAVLTLFVTIFFMLDQIKLVSVAYFALNTPTALFEITLAVYLIIKGFRQVEDAA